MKKYKFIIVVIFLLYFGFVLNKVKYTSVETYGRLVQEDDIVYVVKTDVVDNKFIEGESIEVRIQDSAKKYLDGTYLKGHYYYATYNFGFMKVDTKPRFVVSSVYSGMSS